MNCFLRSRQQITDSTSWLRHNSYVNHPISAKDWELKLIIENIQDGDLLDMGADGSFVLHNAVIKKIAGRKVGIDLAEVTGINKAEGVEYFQGDLMNTGFDDNSFQTITCQSVIEHSVDFSKFAKECGRLLKNGGRLFVSFDFWNPKPETSKMKLYNLDWNILDREDVLRLILEMDRAGLNPTTNIDWDVKDAVINDTYCSPVKGVSYTFGILSFVKNYIL